MDGDVQALIDVTTEDVIWTIPGTFPLSGRRIGHEITRTIGEGLRQAFPQGLGCDILRGAAQDEHVFLEVRLQGLLACGKQYDNCYCMIFTLTDGRIGTITECTDTQRVAELLA